MRVDAEICIGMLKFIFTHGGYAPPAEIFASARELHAIICRSKYCIQSRLLFLCGKATSMQLFAMYLCGRSFDSLYMHNRSPSLPSAASLLRERMRVGYLTLARAWLSGRRCN